MKKHILNKLKNKKWRKRGRWHHTVVLSEIFGEGESTRSQKQLGYPFQRKMGVWFPNGDYFDLEEDWDGVRQIVRQNYLKDPMYLSKYAKHCLQLGEKLIIFSRSIGRRDSTKLTNEQLGRLYATLVRRCTEYMPFMFTLHLFDELLTEKFEIFLQHFIKDKGYSQNEYFDYQSALSLPERKIFVLEERDALVRIARRIKVVQKTMNGVVVQRALKRHAKTYGWMRAVLLEKEPYTVEYYRIRLAELLSTDIIAEDRRLKRGEKELRQRQKKCMAEIQSHKEFFMIAQMVQKFGFLRSFRVDAPFVAYANSWNIVREIGRRLGLHETLDFKYLDSQEIVASLHGEKDYTKLIRERKAGLLSIMIGNERHEITNKKDIRSIFKCVSLPREKRANIIKGSVAYPGKVVGTCRMLYTVEDMEKVEQGDIIVISMTDPNYLPAMGRAAAFVTDMGGILCHAAIISREMRKPCIIGTKIATQVLKDGDCVEVDAIHGVVRKV